MTILTREQIEWLSAPEDRPDGDDLDLLNTARAYHDLRDAVLAIADDPHLYGLDRDQGGTLREVVARVERGGSSEADALLVEAADDLRALRVAAAYRLRVERGGS